MPQAQLPIFPFSSTAITSELAFENRAGMVYYFNGHLPVVCHGAKDVASFRLYTSQFIANGNASQREISEAFGVPLISVKRALKTFREKGAAGFFRSEAARQGRRLTPEILLQAQAELDAGRGVPAIARELEVLPNTLHKAIDDGRLKKKAPSLGVALDTAGDGGDGGGEGSSQSERTRADGETPMGVATTRSMERIAAALGGLDEAAPLFEQADDIPNGGVLCALPALLHLGLLRHSEKRFDWPKGFYSMASIFVLLAFLALGRIRSLEQLRYQAPGEWGKLLGLDRIPEVKTMREKIALLGDDAQRTAQWSSKLAADWMAADVGAAGVLLIDGHTRVYHGKLAKLPRRYIAREKLCLRATSDYWVNAMNGDPFFCVTKAIDPGLIKTLEEDIVPRLMNEVPGQPSAEQLEADLLLHCFTLIFDREGYSPKFFKRMKAKRVAILTYKKNPGEAWASEEFEEKSVRMSNGEIQTLLLAERGTQLSNGLWVREVRLLGENGHQTAVLSTDYKSDLTAIAASMFARWNQENFFKYMRQHYGLDALIEYGISPLPETTKLVNPVWRRLDGQVRSLIGKLVKKRAQFGAMTIDFEIEEAGRRKKTQPSGAEIDRKDSNELNEKAEAKASKAQAKSLEKYETQKGKLLEEIQAMEKDMSDLKAQRKGEPKHVTLKNLPIEQRVSQLLSARKHFVDTIKLLAYRAETTLVGLIKETLARDDESRSFVRAILKTSVNLRPNPTEGVLEIQLHGQANPMHDECATKLCQELNETETKYPGTDLRLKYTTLRSEKKTTSVS